MLSFARFARYLLLTLLFAQSLHGQVNVFNSNTFYDLCCIFNNSTGPQVVHCSPKGSAQLDDIVGQLMLALVRSQPTCSNWEDYVALCTLLDGTAANSIVIKTANNGSPVFTIDN